MRAGSELLDARPGTHGRGGERVADHLDIPADLYTAWDAKAAGAALEAEWDAKFAAYSSAYPAQAAELARRMAGDLPANFDDVLNAAIAACLARLDVDASSSR